MLASLKKYGYLILLSLLTALLIEYSYFLDSFVEFLIWPTVVLLYFVFLNLFYSEYEESGKGVLILLPMVLLPIFSWYYNPTQYLYKMPEGDTCLTLTEDNFILMSITRIYFSCDGEVLILRPDLFYTKQINGTYTRNDDNTVIQISLPSEDQNIILLLSEDQQNKSICIDFLNSCFGVSESEW